MREASETAGHAHRMRGAEISCRPRHPVAARFNSARNTRLDRLAVMERPDPNSPLDYDEALRIARDWAWGPGTVIAYPHQGLENARYGRGFAFRQTLRDNTDGYILVSTTGTGGGILSEDEDIDSVIAEHLAQAEHVNRHIPDSELFAVHRRPPGDHAGGTFRRDRRSSSRRRLVGPNRLRPIEFGGGGTRSAGGIHAVPWRGWIRRRNSLSG